MELAQSRPRSPWRGAVKGGLIAAAVPIVLGLVLSLSMGEEAQEGIGWIFVVGILASPVLFVLGAGGGLLAHLARGREAVAPLGGRPRWAVRGFWSLAGGLAGYAVSELTSFQWPILGGILIGLALIPIWIWIGIAVGQDVAISRRPDRPARGGLVVLGAAYGLLRTLLGFFPMRLDNLRLSIVAAVGSAICGLFAYHLLRVAQQSTSHDLDPAG